MFRSPRKIKMDAANMARLDPNLTSFEKLLFAQLIDHLNMKTGLCCPGEALLAKALNRSERTVRNGMRGLEAAGYVVTIRNRPDQRSNHYILALDTGKLASQKAANSCQKNRKQTAAQHMNENLKEQTTIAEKDERSRWSGVQGRDPGYAKRIWKELERRLVEHFKNPEEGWSNAMKLEVHFSDIVDQVCLGSITKEAALASLLAKLD